MRVSSSTASAIPSRWKRARSLVALFSLAGVALFALLLSGQSGSAELDGGWLRARFTLREKLENARGGAKTDSRILLVELDDKSAQGWSDEPVIMWGGHMADAIKTLNRGGARLIALDWTQPVATDNRLRWNHDARLSEALSQTRDVVFVAFISAGGRYILPTPLLLNSPPEAVLDGGASRLGYADLPRQDSVQSAILPETRAKNDGVPLSFAARIAQRLGAPWRKAPRRNDGSLLINFASNAGQIGKGAPFERVSLRDLALERGINSRYKNKIAIFGATFEGNNDLHSIPFFDTQNGGNGASATRKIAGVELQAHALKTLLDGNSLREPNRFFAWLLPVWSGALGIALFAVWSWRRAISGALGVGIVWVFASFGAFWSAQFLLPLLVPMACLLLGCALMGGFRAFSEERERAQVLRVWGRYQDPLLIRELLENPDLRSGQGREVEVTVLFADLKNFTKTVEHLSPSHALQALNRYLALMATTIREHGGLVDKYLGDGLMASWGAPLERADHARAATLACLEIEKRLNELGARLEREGEVCFGTRLTLHTGRVVAGPLGAEESLEYTLIGDTVNVTSRLQEVAKALDCDFLISETTCAGAGELVEAGRETSVEIRGRQKPLLVFEVLGPKSSKSQARFCESNRDKIN